VGECEVRRLLLEPSRDLRRPKLCDDLEARHVEVAVMEERCELGHITYQEAPILAYAIATHRRRPLIDVTTQECERLLLGLVLGDAARSDTLDQPRRVVLARVPFVHRREHV